MQTLGHRRILLLALGFALSMFVKVHFPVAANVTLTKFEPTVVNGKIRVVWETATETNNAGFNLYRSESATVPTSAANKLNATLIPPKGLGVTGGTYTFDDTTAVPGKKYYYKLESLDARGGAPQYSDIKSAMIVAATNTPAPTATKTNTPLPTATKTNTLVPGAPTFTPAPTNTPTPIPTATNTLAPGAPTFTPAPTATPTVQRVAVAPKPGTANNPLPSVVPTVPASGVAAEPTPINLGMPRTDDQPDEDAEGEIEDGLIASDKRAPAWRTWIFASMLLASGVVGFAGVLLFGLAVLFFVRTQMRQ